ncbi:MAG: hypothetical protein WCK51_01565 [Armatimonadota bacterium]
MVVFHEGAALNTYTYDSDGFKKVENVSGILSTIIWDGTDYLQVRGQSTIKTFHTVESQMMSYIESTLRYDFLTDNLGSITAIMDGSQIRVWDTRYSAYGRKNCFFQPNQTDVSAS